MRRFLATLAIAVAIAGPAQAQPAVTASQIADTVARGLVAQYEAALIRQRRLADQREEQLIESYEARMRELRARMDRGESLAQAQLSEARTQFAAYVATIAARNSDAVELVQAYRTQLANDIAQASPEQLAALQRFADGDQQAGFDQYQAESARRAAARQRQAQAAAEAAAHAARAADAADARQLARLGETMRLQGLKTVAELLALWNRAGELDPSDFETQLNRAQFVAMSGDLSLARTLAEQAQAMATNDRELYNATYVAQLIARNQDDWAAVEQIDLQITAILRRIANADPNNFDAELVARLSEVREQSINGDHAGAQVALEELLGAVRRRIAADPQNRQAQWRLSDVLVRLAFEQRMLGNSTGEIASLAEGVVAARQLSNGDPGDFRTHRNLSGMLFALANAQMRAGDRAGRLASLEENVAVFRRLADASPTDVTALRELGASLGQLSEAQNDDEALTSLTESLAVARTLADADANAETLRNVWVAMWRMAFIPNSGVTWAQLLTVMEDAERRGMLEPADGRFLDEARLNAGRESAATR